jgi:hypothetical protein
MERPKQLRRERVRTLKRGEKAVSTKRLLTAMVLASVMMLPALAVAQDTSSGTLTVTATVDSSIALTFETDAAGVALTGAGTSTATMALGTISAYETLATTGVTRSVTATDFTVSSLFGVKVMKANSTSSNYTLAAALGSADATNTWKINAITLTTTNQNLGNNYSYGSAVPHTMHLTVPVSATPGAISKVLNFTATAN